MCPKEISGIRITSYNVCYTKLLRVGDFNDWNRNINPMKKVSDEIWLVFIADLKTFDTYKYSVESKNGTIKMKSDPFGVHMETNPSTGTKVFEINNFNWTDTVWQEKKKKSNIYKSPINIYEVHLGSWKQTEDGKFYSYDKP